MNILNLLTNKDRIDYSEGYQYKKDFKTTVLFPQRKTDNMKVAIARLVENGALPVMANFHALDAEAKIGDRTNYSVMDYEKLFIKEKLNQTERILYFLNGTTDEDAVRDFIFDDFDNLVSRVLTRVELANCQVLSTGKLEINENNYKTVVDFGYKSSHNVALSAWADPEHSIIDDLNAVVEKAQADGKKLTRALTSSKVVSYLVKNKEIKSFFVNSGRVLNSRLVLEWVYENFGIAFETYDDVYKLSANDTATHRFFPENKIAFFDGQGTLGAGLFGVTPEELGLNEGVSTSGLVTLTQWETNDPVAVWSKASAMYLPVIADIDGLYIGTVSAS